MGPGSLTTLMTHCELPYQNNSHMFIGMFRSIALSQLSTGTWGSDGPEGPNSRPKRPPPPCELALAFEPLVASYSVELMCDNNCA